MRVLLGGRPTRLAAMGATCCCYICETAFFVVKIIKVLDSTYDLDDYHKLKKKQSSVKNIYTFFGEQPGIGLRIRFIGTGLSEQGGVFR